MQPRLLFLVQAMLSEGFPFKQFLIVKIKMQKNNIRYYKNNMWL